MDNIYYHMATMPPRINALKDSIPSILKQCTKLFVYCNNFDGYMPEHQALVDSLQDVIGIEERDV